MAELNLGKLIDEGQGRDAVHVAIAPVVANEKLYPGQDVGFVTSSQEVVGKNGTHIGIIDPFLKLPVQPGQRCWLWLYPNTITSLRHEWTHPAFEAVSVPDTSKTNERSKKWLEDFAADVGLSYEQLLQAGKDYIEKGRYHIFPYDTPDRCHEETEEFWDNFERVTGIEVLLKDEKPFSCAC